MGGDLVYTTESGNGENLNTVQVDADAPGSTPLGRAEQLGVCKPNVRRACAALHAESPCPCQGGSISSPAIGGLCAPLAASCIST